MAVDMCAWDIYDGRQMPATPKMDDRCEMGDISWDIMATSSHLTSTHGMTGINHRGSVSS